jgi:large conductance mechanosensitive channel
MKKFVDEFKAFVLRGNVMDMAVGVIIGGAFTAIVGALTEDFINPLINCIGGAEIKGQIQIGSTGQYINWGHFITAVINFLIMALILFCLLKGINKLMAIGKKKEEEAAEEAKAADIALLEEIRDLLKEKK